MASADDQLPEGTDAIIEGAGVSDFDDAPAVTELADDGSQNDGANDAGPAGTDSNSSDQTGDDGANGGGATGAMFGRFDDLRGQATDRARDFAQAGKDRATSALDSLVQTVEDAAAEIDEKLGSQYGDYARRAAQGIGSFSDSFRDKDVDALFSDARSLIAKSPAVAIGTAAALGFVVARLARAGLPNGDTNKDAPGT